MATKYMQRKTPGVYVTEFPAFGPSVVGVATAIPIFIGYTETAKDPSSNKPVYNQAIVINSLTDFESYFGGPFDTKYYVRNLTPLPASPASPSVDEELMAGGPSYDFQALYCGFTSEEVQDGSPSHSPHIPSTPELCNFAVTPNASDDSPEDSAPVPRFNLHTAVQLFYNNGGGSCYVVSVANYWGTQEVNPATSGTPILLSTTSSKALLGGLAVAKQVLGPTMVVVPDACLLKYLMDSSTSRGETTAAGSPYSDVICEMMNQSASQKDRVAILDLPGAVDSTSWTATGLQETRGYFYDATAPAADSLSYGAAYAPALEVSVLDTDDVDYTNLYGGPGADGAYPSIILMNELLTTQATQQYTDSKLTEVLGYIESAYPADGSPPTWSGMTPEQISSKIVSTNNYLRNALPLLGQILQIMLDKLNVAPPSGAMAGIWTRNDANIGVWNAPANLSLASVVGPKVTLTDEDQEDYNVPLNGQSIGLLRAFPGRGTVVWGARTLDGNSGDFRYIQVRRTLVYVEQSIKQAIQPFVFAPNVGQTWATVTSMVSNFLTGLWSQGGLMGDKASDAFNVQCGLGTTMTSQDILNGYMVVAVTLQMVHPAEFIELTFTQKMSGG